MVCAVLVDQLANSLLRAMKNAAGFDMKDDLARLFLNLVAPLHNIFTAAEHHSVAGGSFLAASENLPLFAFCTHDAGKAAKPGVSTAGAADIDIDFQHDYSSFLLYFLWRSS